MRNIVLGLSVLLMTSVSMADEFYCTLTVNGVSQTEYSSPRPGHVVVDNSEYQCQGFFQNGLTRVYLYEPGETDDDDSTKGYGKNGTSASASQGLGTCTCGLN